MRLLFKAGCFVRGTHVDAGAIADVDDADAKILTAKHRPLAVVFDESNLEHKEALEKLKSAKKTSTKETK